MDVRAPNPDPEPLNRLEAVLAPASPLADVDGVTLLLVSVELWTRGVFLRMAGMGTAHTQRLDEEFQAAADAGGEWPEHLGSRFGALPLTLADDAGTRYSPRGSASGGTATEWRTDWQFAPGVPRAASRLFVTLAGADGPLVQELALPAR